MPTQSTGTVAALSGGLAGYLVTVFMWLCRHFGIDDMTVADATAFVSIAVFVAGGIHHHFEQKRADQNAPHLPRD